MSKVHSFGASLLKGKQGEALFTELWHEPLERLDGRKHDFKLIGTGETLELKTDSYDVNKTPNFFLELYSDVAKNKPGGPWQARKNGTKYWVYFFSTNLIAYQFKTEELAEWLDLHWKDYDPISIYNRVWITSGIKVPRAKLEHLYESFTLTPKKGA